MPKKFEEACYAGVLVEAQGILAKKNNHEKTIGNKSPILISFVQNCRESSED